MRLYRVSVWIESGDHTMVKYCGVYESTAMHVFDFRNQITRRINASYGEQWDVHFGPISEKK